MIYYIIKILLQNNLTFLGYLSLLRPSIFRQYFTMICTHKFKYFSETNSPLSCVLKNREKIQKVTESPLRLHLRLDRIVVEIENAKKPKKPKTHLLVKDSSFFKSIQKKKRAPFTLKV